MRKVVWTAPTSVFHGERYAKVMGWEYSCGPYGDADKVFVVGILDPDKHWMTIRATARTKEKHFHWIGTDVQWLIDPDVLPEGTHSCESEQLKRELFAKGIEADVVMGPTPYHPPVTPLPPEKRVACYLGQNPMQYGSQVFEMLQQLMPAYEFIGFGMGQYQGQAYLDLINDCRVALRLTEHDGSANTAREWMEAGRRAITTCELPHAVHVRRTDIPAIMRAITKAMEADEVDSEAAAYWFEQNSEKRFLDDLARIGVL